MDKTALVTEDIELGAKATTAVRSEMPVAASFWYYFPDAEEWRLVVGTSLVDRQGPRAAYARIQKAIRHAGLTEEFPVYRFAALSPNDPVIKLMRSVIRTGPNVSGIRFTGNVINNVMIEDAYIYFLK